MKTLQNRPTAIFSPGRSLVGSEGPLRQPGGMFGGREWVVPRAECQYRRQDFSHMPVRQRRTAARLALARFEPSAEAAVHIAWLDGVAHYWIWTPSEGGQADYRRWIPETRLLAPPAGDGVRLLQLAQGVEGQVWKSGRLLASQWWPELPEVQAWQYFVRSAGIDPAHAPLPAEAEVRSWLSVPWGETGQGLAVDAETGERFAWMAVLAVFMLALGWQGAGWLRWRAASATESARLESARSSSAPLLEARERAERASADIEHLVTLQRGTSDYRLMADVSDALPEGAQLAGWSRTASQMRILVRTDETDPRRFLSPFAGVPHLSNVTATPTGSGGMVLEFSPSDESDWRSGE